MASVKPSIAENKTLFVPCEFLPTGGWDAPSFHDWRDQYFEQRGINPTFVQRALMNDPQKGVHPVGARFWKHAIDRMAVEGGRRFSFTLKAFVKQVNITRKYLLLLQNDPIQPSEALLQSASYLSGVKVNFLPFVGDPLKDPLVIVEDLIRRSLTLGIDPHSDEFKNFAGQSFEELCAHILEGHSTEDDIDRILTDHFHCRLMPSFATQRVHDEESLDQFLAEIDACVEHWKMSQTELLHAIGLTINSSSQWHKYRKYPVVDNSFTKRLCEFAGVEFFERPIVEPKFAKKPPMRFDKYLADALETEMRRRRLSPTDVCRIVSAKHSGHIASSQFKAILERLRGDYKNVRLVQSQLKWLIHIAKELNIPLLRSRIQSAREACDRLPQDYFMPSSRCWDREGNRQLGEFLHRTRNSINVSLEEVAELLETSIYTIMQFEKGRITKQSAPILKKYLALMKIECVPQWELQKQRSAKFRPTSVAAK